MTQSRSAVERALLTALLLLLPAGLLLVVPVSSGGATADEPGPSSSETVYSESFESGTRGWSTSRKGRITTVADGRRSRSAARLSARTPGLVVASSTSWAKDAAGTEHLVSAWLRSTRGRVAARLVVREVDPAGDRVLATRRDRVRVGRSWKRVQVAVRRSSGSSILEVEVRTRQGRADRVLLDDVSIRRRKEVPVPQPSPGPAPTEETPGAEPGDVAGALSNGCTYTSRGLPSCGAYLGAAYGSNSDPAPMEAATGHRLGVRRTYYQAYQVDKAVSVAKGDLAAGRLPWISFKLPYSWEDMVAGKGDAWALDLAQRLKGLGGPVWVAFHHEPEKDGDITAWRRMQERLAPLVRSAAPNVAYTVVVTGWNQLYGPSEFRFANLWPRGVKIDVAGFDIYNFYGTRRSDGTLITSPDRIKADYFDKIGAWAKDNDVAWGLAETGLTDTAFEADPAWLPRTLAELVETGGVAMAYFNTELNSGGETFPLVGAAKIASFGLAQSQAPLLPKG